MKGDGLEVGALRGQGCTNQARSGVEIQGCISIPEVYFYILYIESWSIAVRRKRNKTARFFDWL